MDKEIWRPVKGWDKYEVSNLGNIRRDGKNKKLSPAGNGYYVVRLSQDGRITSKSVHRIVAEAFLPLVDGKNYVNHIDCNRLNNNVNNLEWCTFQENEIHAWKHGRKEKIRQTSKENIKKAQANAYKNKIKVIQIDFDGNIIKVWDSASDAKRETGIDNSAITKCCRGKLKQTGGFRWQYIQ